MKVNIHFAEICIITLAMILALLISIPLRSEKVDLILEYNVAEGIWGRNDGVTIDTSGNAVYRVRGNAMRSVKLLEPVLAT